MFHRITIIGFVGQPPQMRYTEDGTPVTNFSVATRQVVSKERVAACPQGWKESLNGKNWELTTWFRVTCWRNLAEAVNQYLEMGSQVFVEGEPRAQAIATRQNWRRLGDKLNTWLMPSSTGSGRVYMVNGRCTCKDFERHGIGWWCKHRLARALTRRAAELLKKGNGAGGDRSTPAPSSMEATMNNGTDSTTTSPKGQARRIELVMAYEADEAKILPHINGDGQLVQFKADGQAAEPPGAWKSPRPKTEHLFEPGASRVCWGLGWATVWAWSCGGRPASMFSLECRNSAGGR